MDNRVDSMDDQVNEAAPDPGKIFSCPFIGHPYPPEANQRLLPIREWR
jgi:hypothetical protein